MEMPTWDGPEKIGTKVRIALWLVSVVGVGNVFTKAQLREAFPGVAQADRRMRDLRDNGWQIDTKREDPRLGPNEQRFVAAGEEVWVRGRATSNGSRSVNAALRRRIMADDAYMCAACGISAGEKYEHSIETAQLDIARRTVVKPDGAEEVQLVTECRRCRIGAREQKADLCGLLQAVSSLTDRERTELLSWITAGKRRPSATDMIWGKYRSLPPDSRTHVEKILHSRNLT
ncbi:hypothetical protein ACIP96_03845 [Streptomyces nigra]|uniref:hypothetical protein n=1 Tax=Streptomyces nigra TaxID=1827580 RepID=UPI00382E2835